MVGSDHRSLMRADSPPTMVMPWPDGVHAERAPRVCHPAFPQPVDKARGSGFPSASKLRNHLRPDRNHRDKQRNRRQRRRFFHEQPQHEPDSDVRTYEEHCSFFVPGVKRVVQRPRGRQFPMVNWPPRHTQKSPGQSPGAFCPDRAPKRAKSVSAQYLATTGPPNL